MSNSEPDTRITAVLPSDSVPQRPTPLAILSALTLLAGAGGMAVSFLFLASRNHLDVIAGGAGFVAGVVLLASGLLSLAIQTQSRTKNQSAIHVAGCLMGFLPPLAAVLAWPIIYFEAFLAAIFFMPLILFICVVWAWVVSGEVASHLSALLGWSRVGSLRGLAFLLQVLGIAASWPLFLSLLRLLESLGYKVGWS